MSTKLSAIQSAQPESPGFPLGHPLVLEHRGNRNGGQRGSPANIPVPSIFSRILKHLPSNATTPPLIMELKMGITEISNHSAPRCDPLPVGTLDMRNKPNPISEHCHSPAPSARRSLDTLVTVARLYSRDQLRDRRRQWQAEGKSVVFTNGCYDLLHPGHIRLLEQARSLGDVLILALNSDAGVQRAKGPSRPLIDESERAAVAMALEAVDAVTLFDEDTPRELIAEILPDVLVKGADWSHFVAGREEVEAAGGKVLTLPLEPGFSTTNIVERILSQP